MKFPQRVSTHSYLIETIRRTFTHEIRLTRFVSFAT